MTVTRYPANPSQGRISVEVLDEFGKPQSHHVCYPNFPETKKWLDALHKSHGPDRMIIKDHIEKGYENVNFSD